MQKKKKKKKTTGKAESCDTQVFPARVEWVTYFALLIHISVMRVLRAVCLAIGFALFAFHVCVYIYIELHCHKAA